MKEKLIISMLVFVCAIAIVANWDVYGSVRHWNHIHFRCNTYKAELTIVPSDQYWKLSNLQLLDEERVI